MQGIDIHLLANAELVWAFLNGCYENDESFA